MKDFDRSARSKEPLTTIPEGALLQKTCGEGTPLVKASTENERRRRLRSAMGEVGRAAFPFAVLLVLLLASQLFEYVLLHRSASVSLERTPRKNVREGELARQPAASSPAAPFNKCAARAQWLEQATAGQRMPAPGPLKWPATCRRAEKVCFHNGEIVALDLQNRAASADDGFFAAPDMTRLDWFSKQKVEFNMPGYFDGDKGVQHVEQTVPVRPVARALESVDLLNAPLLNITPVVVYPFWPFNFAETLYPDFFYPWVDFLKNEPSAQLPVVVALPHGLRVPDFWKLMEPLVPAVESFGTISAECSGYSSGTASRRQSNSPAAAGPMCFNQIIGCSAFHVGKAAPGERSLHNTQSSAPANWQAFVQETVSHRCGALPTRGSDLVVGILQRAHNRRLLNIAEILSACRAAPLIDGRRLVCKELDFDNPHLQTEVCKVQDVDVLIGTNSGQLATSMFMRPGSSMIEVRAQDWYHPNAAGEISDPNHWSNAFLQTLWQTNSTQYWWYGASKANSVRGPHSTYARDDDVRLTWATLECMLKQIVLVGGDRATYEQQPHIGSVGLCAHT